MCEVFCDAASNVMGIVQFGGRSPKRRKYVLTESKRLANIGNRLSHYIRAAGQQIYSFKMDRLTECLHPSMALASDNANTSAALVVEKVHGGDSAAYLTKKRCR